MTLPVKLSAVAAEMDVFDDEWTVYIHRRTGKIITITPEDLDPFEDEMSEESMPEEPREHPGVSLEALESDEYVALPDKFEIHEWALMEDFIGTLQDDELRAQLERLIHRRGAFAGFREELDVHGQLGMWLQYRDEAFLKIAADCLEANGIPYERDVGASACT